ncbi:MAG: HDIG domain-containing protein [candidate division WOR-3 bacterium]|nr:MAG: HDIG domain-containing protein [candidate division WOR-3 bacterium]
MSTGVTAILRRLGRARDRLLETRGERRLYLVGGTLRDILLERQPEDFDFAVSGSGVEFARAFADRVRGKFVVLSEPDDEARVVSRGRVFDFNGFGVKTIDDDLRRRDFTINAMACEVLPEGVGGLLDPFRGSDDLRAAVIRPVTPDSLRADPLRLLRGLRLGLELGLSVHDSVLEQGRSVSLSRTAAERIGSELLRILECPRSCDALIRLHQLGRLAEILPDFAPVLEDDDLRQHSFRTCVKVDEVVSAPSFFSGFGPEWQAYFDRWEAETEADRGLPYRRAVLKLCGLLHDIAKPQTRFSTAGGDTHFYGHDTLGARTAEKMVRRSLRLSKPQVKMVHTHVQEHMRLHLLATGSELSDRAIRRFFRDLGDEAFGMMITCYADGWATAGRTSHLESTITRMIRQKRDEDARAAVTRFVNGHDLIALGLEPGPAFKVILQELEDLQLEGTIGSREQGLEYLRTNLPGLAKPETATED